MPVIPRVVLTQTRDCQGVNSDPYFTLCVHAISVVTCVPGLTGLRQRHKSEGSLAYNQTVSKRKKKKKRIAVKK